MTARYDSIFNIMDLSMKGRLRYEIEMSTDPTGNISRINHALESIENKLKAAEQKLDTTNQQLITAQEEAAKPFAQEEELSKKLERLSALNSLLNMDNTGENVLDIEDQEEDTKKNSSKRQLSR